MGLWRTYRRFRRGAAKLAFASLLLLAGAVLLYSLDWGGGAMPDGLDRLPDHNYTPDILKLQSEKKLNEALELTRYVRSHPELPGQEDARLLETTLDGEVNGVLGRIYRVSRGVVMGQGESLEEMVGAVGSDFFIVGDIRDLIIQAGKALSGNDPDPVVAGLAALGLATEIPALKEFDVMPAVLKCFRKAGALTERFARFAMGACEEAVKLRKTGKLTELFAQTRVLGRSLGLARTAGLYRYVNTPGDLATMAKWVEKDKDGAYLCVRLGGVDGLEALRRLPDGPASAGLLAKAARKGPQGFVAMASKLRYGARAVKDYRLGRVQRLIEELAASSPNLRRAFQIGGISMVAVGGLMLTNLGLGMVTVLFGRRGRAGKPDKTQCNLP